MLVFLLIAGFSSVKRIELSFWFSGGLVYFEYNLPWNLKITSFPSFAGERELPLTGLALVNFSRNKKKRRAAHEFIMWLVNKENTITMFKEVGYLPVRKSARLCPTTGSSTP